MIACPNCGKENPEDARFCNACASPLTVEGPGAREERKVVTVLFADLVGFTSQAEQLDPEDVRTILSGYHERVRFELERYGGTVEKFIGDAVMAMFGAPTAREDDPERAVRAALAVREAIAELSEADDSRELHVRVGITTGETLVRLDARPEEGEGMAAGDVVNTAARLQSAAPTDGILVDETTYRATERSIEFREAEPVDAKGKAAPVVAYEALQARARYGVDVRQIGRTPLVGRERELDALTAALARARTRARAAARDDRRRPGDRQEPPRLRALPRPPRRARAHDLAPGPLPPVRRGRLVLGARGDRQGASRNPRHRRRSGGRCQAQPGGRGRPRRGARGRVGRAQPAPARRPRRGVRARCRPPRRGVLRLAPLLRGLAETRPLVLVFEDLHFADDGLLDFVDYLVDWADGRPAARHRHGASGAARAAAGLGRRQGERAHALPLVALGHGDCPDRPRAARPGGAACRPSAAAARAGGWQPPVRRGVRTARRRRQAARRAA